MKRWAPDEPMAEWPDDQRRSVLNLTRLTYLEYCRGGLHPELDGRDASLSALRRAWDEIGQLWWSWEADRVMAGLFNRFHMRSAEGYVAPVRFVERATSADQAYAGPELCKLALFRATCGWTPIFGDHINS